MERDFQGRGSLNSVFDFRDNEKVHQDRFHARPQIDAGKMP